MLRVQFYRLAKVFNSTVILAFFDVSNTAIIIGFGIFWV